MAVTYRASAAAAALSITIDTLRRSAADAGLVLERKQSGATATRVFHPHDLFQIARWRAVNKHSPVPITQAVASIWSPKGGIGKTTMAGNIAVAMGLIGLNVLLVDLDFQGSLTLSMNYDSDITIEEAIEQGLDIEKVVQYHLGSLLPGADEPRTLDEVIKKPYGEYGPHLIPADLLLDKLDFKLLAATLQGQNSDLVLAKFIQDGRNGKLPNCDLSPYDLILFDCPPSKNRLTRSALLASDAVVSPVNFEHFSTKALSYLSNVLTDVREVYGRCPELIVLGNEYDSQRLRSSVHMATIANRYKGALLERNVRRSEDFPRALDEDPRLPLLLSKPMSPAAGDVREIAKCIADRMALMSKKMAGGIV